MTNEEQQKKESPKSTCGGLMTGFIVAISTATTYGFYDPHGFVSVVRFLSGNP
jgi:hypothetical protein